MKTYPFTYCLNPRRITNPYTYETMVVPCLHCAACEQKKASRYIFQIDCEAETALASFLVTLTYANSYIPRAYVYEDPMSIQRQLITGEHVPFWTMCDMETGEILGQVDYPYEKYNDLQRKCELFGYLPYIRYSDLQSYIHRLNERISRRFGRGAVRFFACAEYSPEHFRPHFHIIPFVYNPELLKITHKLSEFPEWTYPYRKVDVGGKIVKQRVSADAPLTEFEFHLRDCWQFGIVDTLKVSEGSPASYVAGYVNSSVPVPPFFTLPSTKCRCSHSRFLGREVFRKALADVFQSEPRDLIRRSLFLDGEYNEVDLPASYYSAVYPKCKGFASLNGESLFRVYKLYAECLDYYGKGCSCLTYAKLVASDLVDCFLTKKTDLYSYSKKRVEFLEYFYSSSRMDTDPPQYSDYILTDEFKHLVFRIYTELLCSYRFLTNASFMHRWYIKNRSYTLSFSVFSRAYLSKLVDFHKTIEMMHLESWYDMMSKYELPDTDDSVSDDVLLNSDYRYFYNNTNYDFNEFKNTLAYREFQSDVMNNARRRVKHKKQNDKNKFFLYG